MSVDILAIKFKHDQASATSDALNIRKNARQAVTVPEWRRGRGAGAEGRAKIGRRSIGRGSGQDNFLKLYKISHKYPHVLGLYRSF